MTSTPRRYWSDEEDSARWLGFPFRQGDIVISTRSKSGTTWVQMICALLVFQTPDLPEPLGRLSPWLDWLVAPREEVVARLEAQRHRRFVKTHTPLDGVPIDPLATYLVVCRHPLDMAVSLWHQGNNIDRERVAELTGGPPPAPRRQRPLREWLVRWTERETSPEEEMDSLQGVLWHAGDAWARRGEPNVVLLHYDDLSADLEGEMRRLAGRLGFEVPEARWPVLVEAAGFRAMRAQAERVSPQAGGVLRDPAAFFRGGRSGDGRAALGEADLARYRARVLGLADEDLLRWLHRDWSTLGIAAGP